MKNPILPLVCVLAFFASAQAEVFYLPHIADGGGVATTFYINNLSRATATGTLTLYSGSGALLSIRFSPNNTFSSTALSIEPNASVVFASTGGSNPIAIGYAKVELNQSDVSCMAILRYSDGREASVLGSKLAPRLALFVERSTEVNTGVALCRTANLPIRLTLFNQEGNPVATRDYDFSGKKTAAFLNELLTVPVSFRGTLLMESASSFTAAGLRYANNILSVAAVNDFVGYQGVFYPNQLVVSPVIQAVNEAEDRIDIAVSSLTSVELADALIAAKVRGVLVRVAVDMTLSAYPGQQVSRLSSNGIEVRKVFAPSSGASMRHNFAIFDQHRVMLGSFEWGVNLGTINYGDLLFIGAPEVIEMYQAEFIRLVQSS